MFSLSKFVVSSFLWNLVLTSLAALGAPFKFGDGSAIPSHWDKEDLEKEYRKA